MLNSPDIRLVILYIQVWYQNILNWICNEMYISDFEYQREGQQIPQIHDEKDFEHPSDML